MGEIMRKLSLILCAAALSGCASTLEIYDDKAATVKGVPFRTPEVYIKTGMHDRHSEGGECVKTAFVEPVALPLGRQYYAQVKPAELAKTGFSMKFTEKGLLSEISLNTEPNADAISAIADALTSLLPFAGIVPKTTDGQGTRVTGKACDAGEVDVKFVPFDEWPKRSEAAPVG